MVDDLTEHRSVKVQRIRQELTLFALWQILRLPGELWINAPMLCPFRPDDLAARFSANTALTWIDHRSGSSGDTFTLLCRLRGCDEHQPAAAVIDEYLAIGVTAGLISNADYEISAEMPGEVQDLPEIFAATEPIRDDAGNWSLPANEQSKPAAPRKTAQDVLVLVPYDRPILQMALVKAAQEAGINEKLYRVLLAELLSENVKLIKRIKIRRKHAKSAIGYSRVRKRKAAAV